MHGGGPRPNFVRARRSEPTFPQCRLDGPGPLRGLCFDPSLWETASAVVREGRLTTVPGSGGWTRTSSRFRCAPERGFADDGLTLPSSQATLPGCGGAVVVGHGRCAASAAVLKVGESTMLRGFRVTGCAARGAGPGADERPATGYGCVSPTPSSLTRSIARFIWSCVRFLARYFSLK